METFIIGGREFTCQRMNAFAANTLLIKLQKVFLPIVASLMGDKSNEEKVNSAKSFLDMDVKEAAKIVAQQIDESVITNIVFPMFNEAKLYCVEEKRFVKDDVSMNQCFTAENLFDFYELVFHVGKYQFSPFFASLTGKFGNLTGAIKIPE